MAEKSIPAVTVIRKEADFRKEIKTAPAPGYLLFGEEDYLKANAVAEARRALAGDEAFSCFNELIIDALDFSPAALRSALEPLPMMNDRKIVLLRGLDFNAMRPAEIDGLCDVLAELKEYDYNTLLIPVPAGAIDEGYLPKRPSALLSRLGEFLTLVQFERCTPAKLNGWCIRHFQHNGAAATPELCATLIDKCGRSMFTLASEIDKISFYALAHGHTDVTVADIDAAASVTAEYDSFAFTNAIMERNLREALAILADLKFRRVEPIFILGEVVRVSCDMLSVRTLSREGHTASEIAALLKLHEFKVSLYQKHAAGIPEERLRGAIRACAEADRALKLSPQGYTALERLICAV